MALFVILALLSCEKKTEQSASSRAPDATKLVREALGSSVTVAPLPEARRPSAITWSPPSCPLEYRFEATVDMRLVGAPEASGPTGLWLEGSTTMLAGDDGVAILQHGALTGAHMENGVRLPGPTQPASSLAETRLVAREGQWVEVDGPSALWSAYGSFPGLVLFLPALPGDEPVASWNLIVHERGDAAQVEASRGTTRLPEGFEAPTPTPHAVAARVQREGWIDVGGTPAVVLSAHWKDVSKTSEHGMNLSADMAYDGHYVVLSSGRLLFATVRGTTMVETTALGREMKQRHDLVASVRLVAACDGPVLSAPDEPAPHEEVLLRRLVELRDAVRRGKADIIVQAFAPEVVAAHGRDAIVQLLKEHVERLGWEVLGTPELAGSVERDGERIIVRMTGEARQPDDIMLMVHTLVQAEVRNGEPRIIRISTDSLPRDADWQILEISRTRLHAGTP